MSTTTGYEYKPKSNAGRIANFVDTRVGMSGVVKEFGRKNLSRSLVLYVR